MDSKLLRLFRRLDLLDKAETKKNPSRWLLVVHVRKTIIAIAKDGFVLAIATTVTQKPEKARKMWDKENFKKLLENQPRRL